VARFVKSPFTAAAIRNESGLTLLEMILALALAAILLMVTSEYLFSAAGLWIRYDKASLRGRQLNQVQRVLAGDLDAMVAGPYLPEAAFQGETGRLVFWMAALDGLRQVTYEYDPTAQTVSRSSGFWGAEPRREVLFKQVLKWEFEYFELKTKSWRMEWGPGSAAHFPGLLRVTFQIDKGGSAAVALPFRTRLEEAESDE
jgi:prepilin-type N-terminal cleavage/methylation domain-containing protein